MSHGIENNMMAWKGLPPWHDQGFQVEPTMTGIEMLKVAKMFWRVQRRMLAMRSADGTGLLSEQLKEFRAIVRMDTDEVFQVATRKYHPVQNEDIVDYFREYCDAGHAVIETVGAIGNGRKVWVLARLNGGSNATIMGCDELRGYMLLATSHDGSLQTIGKPTQTRVVCWNTLRAALGLWASYNGRGALGKKEVHEFRMRHTTKWTPEIAQEAKRVMGMAVEQVQHANTVAAELAKHSIDDAGRLEFVKRLIGGESILEQVVTDHDAAADLSASGSLLGSIVDQSERSKVSETADLGRLGKSILEAIISSPGSDLPSAKNTWWGAVNGVTYHVDHERGRTRDTGLNAAWFGDGDRLKSSAVKLACDMTGVAIN